MTLYNTALESEDELVARISAAATEVRDMPGLFETVRQFFHRRCETCIQVGDRSFETLL